MMKKIDIHIHLAGTGCNCSGCWINPKFRRRYTIKILQILHRISNRQMDSSLDRDWGEMVSTLVRESAVDFGVVLGFDGTVNAQTGNIDRTNSQMIIPPSWVFSLCRSHKNLLPGPSINPHARNALDILEECIENRAVLIKWLPSAQLINPSDKGLDRFYRRLADAGIPLLIHCGGEKTFKSLDPALNNVEHLETPLSFGVKVICAHTGTRVIGTNERDQLPELKVLLRKYQNLWVDNSGICNPSRFSHLPKLAADTEIVCRTLYGSDWPVPPNAYYYIKELGFKKVFSLEAEKNWITRDIAIKRAFGYTDETLTRAHQVLANLDYWLQVCNPGQDPLITF
jgi:predicted TIM-barrel fold metal-dependent hydrolase